MLVNEICYQHTIFLLLRCQDIVFRHYRSICISATAVFRKVKTGSGRYGLSSITYLSPFVQRIILKSLAVDESLIKFHSRLSYVQFNPSKLARFGVKFHKLCESSRSYCLNSSIYTGKSEKTPATDGLLCSKTVVLDLVGKRLPDSHTIFMDK